jgi:hypothetical protein
MSDIAVWNILASIIGIVGSIGAAYYFGDLAGQKAAQKHEAEKADRERRLALEALINQVELIKQLIETNRGVDVRTSASKALIRVPVRAFEVAFVSERPALSNERELLDAVGDYLSKAYSVNALLDVYHSLLSSPGSQSPQASNAFEHARKRCDVLPGVLDKLGVCLQNELDSEDG